MDAPALPPRPHGPLAAIHFDVNVGLLEVRRLALEKGWADQGFTALSIAWVELHFTTDAWSTSWVVKSTDVPSPFVNGWFLLPRVKAGDTVEFAVHAGITCRMPEDHAMFRDQASLWFNNGGKNYTQVAR